MLRLIGMGFLLFTVLRAAAEILPVETLLDGGPTQALLGGFPRALVFVAAVTAGSVVLGWFAGKLLSSRTEPQS